MEKITLNMNYGYKGSTNCTVTLQKDVDGIITVLTSYGEVVAACTSGRMVAKILQDLADEVYA